MPQDAQFNDGIGMNNAVRVQYFYQGIKSKAGIEVALSTSCPNHQYEDFDALISFLAAEVEHHKLRKAQLLTFMACIRPKPSVYPHVIRI